MSFDLAVWDAEGVSAASPRAFYEQIVGSVADSRRSDAFQQFLDELTAQYPPLDDLPEEDADESPWACGPEVGLGHCLLYIRWGREQEILEFVVAEAKRRSLVVYDPQADQVLEGGEQAQ